MANWAWIITVFFRSHRQATKVKIWCNCFMHRVPCEAGSLYSALRCLSIVANYFLPAPQSEDVATQRQLATSYSNENRMQSKRNASLSWFSFCKQAVRIIYTSIEFLLQEFLSLFAIIFLKGKISRILYSLKSSSKSCQAILMLK